LFWRSETWLSQVFNDTTTYLYKTFHGILRWHPQIKDYNRLLDFGKAIEAARGGGCGRIWGFIDGTFRGFQNPGESDLQTFMYSGQKKAAGMKWQAIVTPNGLVSSLIGPWEGKANDWAMYCGGVKWLAPEKSPDLAHAEHILAVQAGSGQ